MKPRLRFTCLLLLLLGSAAYCGFLYADFRQNQAKILGLRQQLADSDHDRAQNDSLRKILAQLDDLEALRKDNAELLLVRKEIRGLEAIAEKRKLAAARSLDEQISQLQTENLQLRDQNFQLEQAPKTVSARQAVDVDELTQIAEALSLYAKMNDNNLPEQFGELKHYTSADVFSNLEITRFELMYQGKLTNIADPVNTPLARAKAKDSQNQRPYLFADGHLEIRDE